MTIIDQPQMERRQFTRRAKRIILTLLLLALVSTFNLSFADGASAYSSTQLTSEYPWPHNGCSSPTGDAPSGVSFTYACNHHDGCYNGHWSNKWTCDWWFYNDMRAACGWNAWCQAWAYAYYRSVDKFGWPFYLCRCDPSPPAWLRP